jgi:cysteine-rich repeat protein
VSGSGSVALSKDTAYITRTNPTGVSAFDFDGNELTDYSPISLNSAYWIAYAEPTLPPVCGDWLKQSGEVCDGSDFDGDSCQHYEWQNGINFTGGQLTCDVDCAGVSTSSCWTCGDGVMNPDELCDATDLGGSTCQDNGFDSGVLGCATDCTFDTSGCYTCGNGLIEDAEDCEGLDLQGSTCESIGYVSGTLACGATCMFDTSACSLCGNSVADPGETCDGTDTPGIICQTYPGASFTGGTLGCNSACSDYDTSGCYTCGDGNVDPTEECDGANLTNQTCESLGYTGGTLACYNNCTLNITGCNGAPTEICGNNVIDALEECDDGGRQNGDGCDENCRLESLTCGDMVIDTAEDCDGTELGGATCQTIGYDRGVLFCGGNCRFNSSDCKFNSGPQTIIITPDAPAKTGDLSGELLEDYNSNLQTLTPGCVFQDLNGDLGVTVETGRYCNVDGFNPVTKDRVFFHLYIPQDALDNEPPVVRFYTNGTIAENLGGQIKAVTGLEVRTIVGSEGGSYQIFNTSKAYKVNEGKKFLSMHPDPKTPIPGRWLRVVVDKGSSQFCTDESATNCAVLVGGKNGVAIINLDELENMNQYVLKVKDSGGCNTSGSSDFSLVFPFLAILFLFMVRRRNA